MEDTYLSQQIRNIIYVWWLAHVKTLQGHLDLVFCVKFSPQLNLIVLGSFDERIWIWEVKTGRCLHAIYDHSMPVMSMSFNRDGSLIVFASHDGTCKIWDSSMAT
jgi:COMPASS component SWD3